MNNRIDLTPDHLDLSLYAGDGISFEIDFEDENEVAIDVSSYTWTAQIRKTRGSDTSYSIDINTDNAATGIIILHIPSTVTSQLPDHSQWDLQSVSIGETEPTTVLQGRVTCTKDVTRSP